MRLFQGIIVAGFCIGSMILGNPVTVRAEGAYQAQYDVPPEKRDDVCVDRSVF